jgi:predicted anti-sigma-YlaC factor YlaD
MKSIDNLLHILTLRCEAASELSSRELDESLGVLDRVALRGHLLVCGSCRRFRAQIRLIRRAIRHHARVLDQAGPDDWALSREARTRIAFAIREAAGTDAGDIERPVE